MIAGDIVRSEFAKLRRSRVTWISFAVYAAMVAFLGLMVWLMRTPGEAARLGLVGQKAAFAFAGKRADWAAFLGLVVEMGGIGGLVMVSIAATFVFGREYAEGTAKNMLTLPIPRGAFVLAKLAVVGAWALGLALWLIALSLPAGIAAGLGPLPLPACAAAAEKLLALAAMALACSTAAAWVAVETRGYFAALGFVIGSVVLASLFGGTGWGPWLPWSVVGLYSGAGGEGAELGWGSYAIVLATFAAGSLLILRHETLADNSQ